jgi:hypothetical protein
MPDGGGPPNAAVHGPLAAVDGRVSHADGSERPTAGEW